MLAKQAEPDLFFNYFLILEIFFDVMAVSQISTRRKGSAFYFFNVSLVNRAVRANYILMVLLVVLRKKGNISA